MTELVKEMMKDNEHILNIINKGINKYLTSHVGSLYDLSALSLLSLTLLRASFFAILNEQ